MTDEQRQKEREAFDADCEAKEIGQTDPNNLGDLAIRCRWEGWLARAELAHQEYEEIGCPHCGGTGQIWDGSPEGFKDACPCCCPNHPGKLYRRRNP